MKIMADKFFQLCKRADIPIMKTERKLMWWAGNDREIFLALCRKNHIPLTKDEILMLKWTPEEGDDEIIAWEKYNYAYLKACKIFKQNKRGEKEGV